MDGAAAGTSFPYHKKERCPVCVFFFFWFWFFQAAHSQYVLSPVIDTDGDSICDMGQHCVLFGKSKLTL